MCPFFKLLYFTLHKIIASAALRIEKICTIRMHILRENAMRKAAGW